MVGGILPIREDEMPEIINDINEAQKAIDDALLEEKKKKDREAQNYFMAAKHDQQQAEFEQERFKKNLTAFLQPLKKEVKKVLPEAIQEAIRLMAVAELVTERKNQFFKLDDSKESQEVKEDLKKSGITEEQFATVAFAGLGPDKMKTVANFFKKDSRNVPDEEIKENYKFRDEAVKSASNAIKAFVNGDPLILAHILAGGLRVGCEAFAMVEDKDSAMQWSIHTGEMLDLLKSKPELIEMSGLTKHQLKIAEDVVGMGRWIKSGLMAMDRLGAVDFGKERISTYEDNSLKAAIVGMETYALEKKTVTVDWDAPEAVKEEPKKEAPKKDAPVLNSSL